MPELPEVENARVLVEKHCLGASIIGCLALEAGGGNRHGLFDDIVIGEDITAESLKLALEHRTILAVRRRGKQLWFELDKSPHVLFHFGMTGAFIVEGEEPMKYRKFKVDKGSWPPKFTKLELHLSNGKKLALTDPRRLARVKIRDDPERQPPISSLGPDPITHPITLEDFAVALSRPSAPIKAILLAQDRVISGVGNWIADEVCFQGGVHPGAQCNTLSPEQVASLHASLMTVCQVAVTAEADYSRFPADWLFHHRWGKGKGSNEGTPRVSTGHRVMFDTVGGRTTAIVPEIQKMGLLCHGGGSSSKGGEEGQGKGSRRLRGKAKAGAKASASKNLHRGEKGAAGEDGERGGRGGGGGCGGGGGDGDSAGVGAEGGGRGKGTREVICDEGANPNPNPNPNPKVICYKDLAKGGDKVITDAKREARVWNRAELIEEVVPARAGGGVVSQASSPSMGGGESVDGKTEVCTAGSDHGEGKGRCQGGYAGTDDYRSGAGKTWCLQQQKSPTAAGGARPKNDFTATGPGFPAEEVQVAGKKRGRPSRSGVRGSVGVGPPGSGGDSTTPKRRSARLSGLAAGSGLL